MSFVCSCIRCMKTIREGSECGSNVKEYERELWSPNGNGPYCPECAFVHWEMDQDEKKEFKDRSKLLTEAIEEIDRLICDLNRETGLELDYTKAPTYLAILEEMHAE